MFRRVREFLAPGGAQGHIGRLVGELGELIGQLEQHGMQQEALQRRVRAQTASLRQQAHRLRREHMKPVALAARKLFPTGETPQGPLPPSMTVAPRKVDYEQLVLAARGMASAVEPHAEQFVGAGLEEGFVAKLRAAADAVVVLIDARSGEQQSRIASTQGVEVEAMRGMRVVHLLDALVTPSLRGDPARRAAWRKALYLGRVGAAGGGEGDPALPESAAVVAPVASVADVSVAAGGGVTSQAA